MDETLERLAALITDVPLGANGEHRLPTERKLASILEVNRGTVRERLAALEILGLIRRRQGSGTYLGMPHPTFIRLYFEMAVKLGYVEIGQLQQARELIERRRSPGSPQPTPPLRTSPRSSGVCGACSMPRTRRKGTKPTTSSTWPWRWHRATP